MEQANEKIARLTNEVNQLKENQQKIIKYVIQLRDDRDKIVEGYNGDLCVIEYHIDRCLGLGDITINDFMKDDELFQEEE